MHTKEINMMDVMADVAYNGTYSPALSRVIFNVGTKSYPILDDNGKRQKDKDGNVVYGEPKRVLTTIIYFADATKCVVTNSEHDGVTFNDDGTATDISKEMGVVYCFVKRMNSTIDANGNAIGNGFGTKLHKVVTNAYDTVREERKNKELKAAAKAKYEAAIGTAKPKRPSFADTVVDLRAAVDGMNQMIDTLKADLAELKASK